MRKKIFLALLLGLYIPFVLNSSVFAYNKKDLAHIEKKFTQDLILSDLLKYAYRTNPSIAASRESWKVFIENYRIQVTWPDPQLMTSYFPSPIETRLGPQDWSLTLSQVIPFPGSLTQKGRVIKADTRIARLKLDKTIKDMVTKISSSYYELIYIQTAINIAKANFNLNQDLVKISENSYAKDKSLFYDISKAQAQTAQIQYDILLLKELEQTEKARINTLINRTPDASLGHARDLVFKNVVYSLNEIYGLAMAHQEDILIAGEQVIKSEEAVKLSRYDSLPSFKLGLFYAAIGEPDVTNLPKDAGDDAVGIQLGLNLPIWFGKNKSRISRARAFQQKARADKRTVENRTKEIISRLWFKLQNSKRLITLYKMNLIPQALRSVQTAETWYRQGNGSFADFLEIQATAYNFQLSLARAKADYGKTLVRLEQLTGVILDKKTPTAKGGKNS